MGSGSSGNCTYLATSRTRVLVDLGFGKRSLRRRLHDAGLKDDKFAGILLSHGHSDHVKGAAALAKERHIPVFLTPGTRQEVPALADSERVEEFEPGDRFQIGDIQVEPFSVPHDCAQPVGFRFLAEGISGAVITDLGRLSEATACRLSGCDWLMIESNHDEEMLKVGPYPWFLKMRLLSDLGHLSNQGLAAFLAGRYDGHARHIFLAHLSRQNNDPVLALESAREALVRASRNHDRTKLHLTDQVKPSIVLEI